MKKYFNCLIALSFLSITVSAQPPGYYNGTDGKSGEGLKQALHEIINKHVDFSYYYSKFIINYSDADPANPDNVILFYLQEPRNASEYGTGGDKINREHVWAKSHGGFSGIRPMDGDAFNLRPADASVNTSRSNKDFDNVQPGGTQHPEANECWYNSTSWEPGPATKGQVARILFYMATRYEGTNGEMDLEVVDKVSTSPSPEHGKLSTLLEWNKQYPPTDFERQRNERIFQMQQNRNPFIDHPEFANYIWNNETPDGAIAESLSFNPEIPKPGGNVEVSLKFAAGSGPTGPVTIYWGDSYGSEDNQAAMTANENNYSANINLNYQAGDMLYFKVETAIGQSKKYFRASCLLPKPENSLSITPISDVQGTQSQSPLKDNVVTISGRVVANYDGSFYIQNGKNPRNGVCIYGSMQTGNIGDSMVVTGKVTEFANLTELVDVSYSYNFKNNKHVEPVEISINDINEDYEGMLVKINNVQFDRAGNTIAGSNASYGFSTPDGNAVIFSRQGSRLSGKQLPTGTVSLVGVVGQYNSTYQLMPRNMGDFDATTNNSLELGANKAIQVYPNPASSVLKINTAETIQAIKVIDVSGKTRLMQTGNNKEVSVQSLTPGLYYLSISTQRKGVFYAKFLKKD